MRRTKQLRDSDIQQSGSLSVGGATPSREAIAQRAYEIFQARGATHGRADEDWLQAERELVTAPRVS